VVPHRGTNWAALWLTAQIRRDAVLSESYGRGYKLGSEIASYTKIHNNDQNCYRHGLTIYHQGYIVARIMAGTGI
jgi:hypothetical protein